MTKQHFIALADAIRFHNRTHPNEPMSANHIGLIADFCRSQNPNFMRERWLSYIAGECGSNGGAIRKDRAA